MSIKRNNTLYLRFLTEIYNIQVYMKNHWAIYEKIKKNTYLIISQERNHKLLEIPN